MPANKNQIRRIQTILKMMRQNRYPNYTSFIKEMKDQDLAGAYKLSSKTFQRDIADLRDEYGAPIHYDTSRKGFYLTNPDWYNEDLMVEPFEMKAALLGERIAGNILGVLNGENAIPEKWRKNLREYEIVRQIAEDLHISVLKKMREVM